VRNIQAAVSRLDYGPSTKDVKITNIKQGITVFRPKPGKQFSLQALQKNLKAASYRADAVSVTATGILEQVPDPRQPDRSVPALVVKDTGNLFILTDAPKAAGDRNALSAIGTAISVMGQVRAIPGVEDTAGQYLLSVQQVDAQPKVERAPTGS
jgi:hypothetical protein